jgi:hypothetical protein
MCTSQHATATTASVHHTTHTTTTPVYPPEAVLLPCCVAGLALEPINEALRECMATCTTVLEKQAAEAQKQANLVAAANAAAAAVAGGGGDTTEGVAGTAPSDTTAGDTVPDVNAGGGSAGAGDGESCRAHVGVGKRNRGVCEMSNTNIRNARSLGCVWGGGSWRWLSRCAWGGVAQFLGLVNVFLQVQCVVILLGLIDEGAGDAGGDTVDPDLAMLAFLSEVRG